MHTVVVVLTLGTTPCRRYWAVLCPYVVDAYGYIMHTVVVGLILVTTPCKRYWAVLCPYVYSHAN